jgi:hypothetical protein
MIDSKAANGRSTRRIGRLLLDHMWPARFGIRTLLKDPVAIFSAPWIADNFSADVLVLIRHPAAYVSSVLRENWHMQDFECVFLQQPKLLARFGEDDIQLIEETVQIQLGKSTDRSSLIRQAASLWRLFHTIITQYQKEHDQWLFVRYEDLAGDPMKCFDSIMQQLGLPEEGFGQVHAKVAETALVKETSQRVADGHVKKYDSRVERHRWKFEISEQEITEIRSIVEPVSHEFYCDAEW